MKTLTCDEIWENYKSVLMSDYSGDQTSFSQPNINLLMELKLKAKDEQIRELNEKFEELYAFVHKKPYQKKQKEESKQSAPDT